MPINFDTTYSGSQVSTGAYAAATLVSPPSYTGSSLVATGTSYTIVGSIAATGNTVSVQTTTALGTSTSTATYEGYISVGGATYYVFADPALLGVRGAFAVSSTGATVSVNALSPIQSGIPAATCFLTGTNILTPSGEIPVETIREGDLVAALRGGAMVFEPVHWVGRGTGHVTTGSDAIDVAPVRIARDAIAVNVPNRDLLVTPEHCLHLDGVLIPARMLVNDASITSEQQLGSFAYFHLELETHAILLANGLETESYLDTGNRSNFHNNAIAALSPQFASPTDLNWSDDAAAPLAVDRETVEPIWNRLAERARSLGFSARTTERQDGGADLRIVTATGEEILPTLGDGRVFAFVVPAGSGPLHLRSRSARPSDAIGPFVDDRRSLGVQVGRIGTNIGQNLQDHLGEASLPGWYDMEGNGSCRWTNGNALLPIEAPTDGPLFIDIEVTGVGPYGQMIAKAA